MMYHEVMLYTVEQVDEIVEFDAEKHSTVTFNSLYPGCSDNREELTLFERLVGTFFYNHACEVWHKTEHHPDHDVAIIVSAEQLAKVFDENVEVVREAVQKLIECQVIGIVLLPDGRYAYHFVL